MFGQLVMTDDRTASGTFERADIAGMPVLRGYIHPQGWMYRRKLRQIFAGLKRNGVRRILAPQNFGDWDIAHRYGIGAMRGVPFLRANAAEILLLAMERAGMQPERCVVALRGGRVGREMVAAAETLVPRVRDISVTAPNGGGGLQVDLRQRWGVAVRPDCGAVDGAICFHQENNRKGRVVIVLCEDEINLAGLSVNEEKTASFYGAEPLSVLGALWETGRLNVDAIEFYLT